jgi:transcriptional regulator with XRE-family HTH domain
MPEQNGTNEDLKRHFADRLRQAMQRKSWSSAQLVQASRQFLSAEQKFGAAHVSHYLNGRAIPKMPYLRALSRALDVSEQELLGATVYVGHSRAPSMSEGTPEQAPVRIIDAGHGKALLEIHQRVAWPTALEVLAMLTAEPKDATE